MNVYVWLKLRAWQRRAVVPGAARDSLDALCGGRLAAQKALLAQETEGRRSPASAGGTSISRRIVLFRSPDIL
eukprot:14571529-Heterocapsa_arctica.AAC.1